jgi:PQQ-dependent catabolism-associated CXXCW motif protein
MSSAIRSRLRRVGLTLLVLAVGGAVAAAAAPEEPAGYRLEDYRAAVPLTVAGGEAIDTAQALALWQARRAVFVDVLPAPRRPDALPAETLWKPVPRRDIPGSLWLPEVGRGALSIEVDAYFRDGLARATRGDKAAPIVLYCLADCWMSWNATKRAASYGYTQLYWYRDGTTGWEAAQLPLEEAMPARGRP